MDYPIESAGRLARFPHLESTSKRLTLRGDGDDEQIDLRRYWYVVQKHKWSILGPAFIITVLAGLVVSVMNPVYRSTATLIIEAQQPKVLSIEEISGVNSSTENYIQTQIETLKSRDLARRVINKLKLSERPEFAEWLEDPPLWRKSLSWLHALVDYWLSALTKQKDAGFANDGEQDEALIATFLSNLTVTPRMKTQLVDVSFDSRDPQLARQIVDSLGEAFINRSVEERTDITRMAAQWLENHLQTLRDKYTESEKRLQDYLEKENLIDLQGVLTLTGKQIEGNTTHLGDAQKARVEAESLYNKVRSLNDKIYNSVEVVPEIFDDAGVRDLKQKEAEVSRKLSELAERYGPEHPSMVAARSELESLRASLKKQIASVVSGIKNRSEVVRANELAALRSLEVNRGQVQDIGVKQVRVRELEREVESNIRLYEMFFNRFQETSEAADLNAANIHFVDHASNPILPTEPQKARIIGVSFAGALFMGVLLAFLRDYLDQTVKTPEDVETKLDVPVLGMLPLIKASKSERLQVKTLAKFAIDQPQSGFAEVVRTIRTGLMLSGLGRSHNAWLVSSSVPGEGKSITAMNLAYCCAQTDIGRVLLIDADLRYPTLDKYIDVPPGSPGLSDILAGAAGLEACTYPISGFQLDVMLAGHISSSPLEILSSQAFAELMVDLKKRYKTVLIDSPPMLDVSDAYLLAQHVSAVIYVVKANDTAVPFIKNGLKSLEYFNIPLAGIVLNQADVDNNRYYRHGNYNVRLVPHM